MKDSRLKLKLKGNCRTSAEIEMKKINTFTVHWGRQNNMKHEQEEERTPPVESMEVIRSGKEVETESNTHELCPKSLPIAYIVH